MLGANQYILTWEHFSEIHEDSQHSFENLCRSLFRRKLCKENEILHSDPNHPGVEVAPVLEKSAQFKEVYLPSGKWKNVLNQEVLSGPTIEKIVVDLKTIPVFEKVEE